MMAIVDHGRDAELADEGRHQTRSSGQPPASIADLFGHALWKGRWILVLAAVLGSIVGAIIARSMRPVYEAAATLLMTETREPDAVNSPQTLHAIADSNVVATRVLADLGLDRPPHSLTPDAFRTGNVAVEELRGGRMIRVKVTLPDAALAARGADATARQTVELARSMNQQDTTFLRDYLRAQLEAAQTRKAQLEREMVAYRGNAQLELVETDADALLQQRSQLLTLVVDIAAEEARLATAERELARQERILMAPRRADIEGALVRLPPADSEQRRTADDAPATMAQRREQADQSRRRLFADLGVPYEDGERWNKKQRTRQPALAPEPPDQRRTPDTAPVPPEAVGEFVNPVYEILDYQAAVGRTRLAALRRQRDELINVRKIDAQQLQTLSTMYRTQIDLRKLQTEYDLAERIYLDLSMKHEQARVKALSSSAHVQVLDPAVRPTEPVAPRKRRIVAAGAVSGLLLALTGVIVAAALGSRRAR